MATIEQRHYWATPEYYGMLAFSLAGQGELLAAEVDANTAAIKAYATRPKAGSLVITLINKGATESVVHLDTTTQHRQASVLRLKGGAVDARTGISLGEAQVNSRGTWKPAKAEVLQVREGRFTLHMPAASAAISTFSHSDS